MSNFTLGQVFLGTYPSEAADWCNESGIYCIRETGTDTDEQRVFTIVEAPKIPEPELNEDNAAQA